MPASKALIEQLLALPEDARGELGDLLNEDRIEDRLLLGQLLLESVTDEMSPEERAELEAELEAAHVDVEAGRTRPAADVVTELMAQSARRAAG